MRIGITEHNCRQAIKGWGYNLDGSRENEGNLATPDGSVGESNDCSSSSGNDSQVKSVQLSDCEDSDYYSDDSRENEESPAKSPNNENCTPTDQQTSSERPDSSDSDRDPEDEDSSYSSSDYLFLEDSLLAKLEILLTESEERLIDEFCNEMKSVEKENDQKKALTLIQCITDKYLREGIRLNSCYGERYRTVTNLVFEEMIDVTNNKGLCPSSSAHQLRGQDISYVNREEVLANGSEDIMRSIISNLLSKGGKVERGLFDGGELGQYPFRRMV